MRGVGPEQLAKYEGGGATFKCLDGRGEVPARGVNDEFCDCADGSDEPGTGACAGKEDTLFHCTNAGATPQLVYASRVDDGICDCCDGSDEAGLAARRPGKACANSCKEEGEKNRLERAERLEKLKVGLDKKLQIIASAETDRAVWMAELDLLQKNLPGLEAAVEEAKKAEVASSGCEECKAEVLELRKTVEDLQKEVADLKAKAEAATDAGAAAGAEKPVVSEYAKWMDGAGSTPGAIDTPTKEEDEAAPSYEDDESEDPGPVKSVVSSVGKANSEVSAAEKKVRENKDSADKLQKQINQLSGDKLGFASVLGKCLSKHDGQYEYKMCFFDEAKQDHVLLGRWHDWTGPREATFTNGHMCPGGPARELKVIFECGSEEEVLDVSEPSRCAYEAHATHPGACRDEDMAALEKPPVRHPKDEL